MGYKTDLCGIYKIENLVNHKVYIGQSRSIKSRWHDHKKELNKNSHANSHLQRAWNMYGEESFSHEILELCTIDELNDREKYWINKYNSFDSDVGYNLTSGGDTGKELSEETRKKLIKNGYKTGMINAKKVICLETGEIFDTIVSAANKYGVNYSVITRVCEHVRNTGGGQHWLFYDEYLTLSDEEIEKYKNLRSKTRPVIYLNTNQIFDSIKEASEITGVNVHSINQCCTGGRPRAGCDENGTPRIFKYLKDYENEIKAS